MSPPPDLCGPCSIPTASFSAAIRRHAYLTLLWAQTSPGPLTLSPRAPCVTEYLVCPRDNFPCLSVPFRLSSTKNAPLESACQIVQSNYTVEGLLALPQCYCYTQFEPYSPYGVHPTTFLTQETDTACWTRLTAFLVSVLTILHFFVQEMSASACTLFITSSIFNPRRPNTHPSSSVSSSILTAPL